MKSLSKKLKRDLVWEHANKRSNNILILTNYILNYRNKLFNHLSCSLDGKLTVIELQSPKDEKRISDKFESLYDRIKIPHIKIGKIAINNHKDLLKILFEEKPDIGIINDNLPNFLSNILMLVFSKIYNNKVKILYWTEDFSYSNNYLNLYKRVAHRIISKIMYISADGVLCFNSQDYDVLSKKGKHAVFVPQSSNTVAECRYLTKPARTKPAYGYLGYIKSRKNIKLLINLIERYQEYEFIIGGVGDEHYLQTLKSFHNVKWLGFVFEKDKEIFFKNIDFLILPSYYDTWGLVVNEALSTGTLVIVSDGVFAKEMVQKVDGNLIFRNNDLQHLISIFNYSLELFNNKELFEKLRHIAIDVAKEYSIEKSSESFLRIINKIKEGS